MSELIRGITILTGAIALFVIKNLLGAALIGVAVGCLATLPATLFGANAVSVGQTVGMVVFALLFTVEFVLAVVKVGRKFTEERQQRRLDAIRNKEL